MFKFTLIALALAGAAADDHDGHNHGGEGGEAYEWVGVFELEHDAHYTWTSSKTKDGDIMAYVDPAMKVNVVELEVEGDDYKLALENIKEAAAEQMENDCDASVMNGESFPLPGCRNLKFDDWFYTSVFGMVEGTPKDPHEGHDHGGGDFEWKGLFELHHGEQYSWIAQSKDEGYADPMMKLVILEADGGEDLEAALDGQEKKASELMHSGCVEIEEGETITPGICVNLHFDLNKDTSTFVIDVPGAAGEHGHYAFFAEHLPVEFERDMHYLKQGDVDIEPLFEEGGGDHDGHNHGRRLTAHNFKTPARRLDDHDGHEHGYFAMFAQHVPTEFEPKDGAHYLKDVYGGDIEPLYEEGPGGGGGGGNNKNYPRAWKNSMLACLAVLAVTTVGALVRAVLVMLGLENDETKEQFTMLAGAFAVGCLLATSYFLIFVEAVHLTGARWQNEAQSTWRFGTMALLGYFCGMLGAMTGIGHYHGDDEHTHAAHAVEAKKLEEGKEGSDAVVATETKGTMYGPDPNWGFIFTIFFGDFLHNFVDGIFIANAFLDCSQSKGWTIAGATVAHEIAQETSDYFLLITEGGLNNMWALIINIISGVSIFIGAAVFLWTKPGNGTRGLILAFSGGIYVYIAATEAAATFIHKKMGLQMKLGIFFLFILGAVLIGLVLLDHEHCEGSEGGEGDAGGHAH